MTAIVNDGIVVDGEPPSQSSRTKSDKAIQTGREQVIFSARLIQAEPLIGDREAVFLPGTEEQRDGAMVEDVEKVAKGRVMVLAEAALDDERRIMLRQDSLGTKEPHEGDGHLRQ